MLAFGWLVVLFGVFATLWADGGSGFLFSVQKTMPGPTKDDHFSIPPKILESIRRNPRVTHRAPDVAVRAIGLWRSGCRG